MIRINLLAPERAAKAKPKAGPSMAPGALPSVLLIVLFAGGAAALCAGLWLLKTNELAALDKRIGDARQRQAELQTIQQQVDAFQKKKATLENKVRVIERLRMAQKSPVHMLDEISKALPDYLWLGNMDETRGGLRFRGQSNSLAAVADFMAALQRSGWFPQVDLISSTAQGSLVTFEMAVRFSDPELAARDKAAQAAAPAPKARPGRGR